MISRVYNELLSLKYLEKLSDEDFKILGRMLIHKINFNNFRAYTSYGFGPYTLKLMLECCSDDIKPALKGMLRRRVLGLPLVWEGGQRVHDDDEFCNR